jgi:hypothetical protein
MNGWAYLTTAAGVRIAVAGSARLNLNITSVQMLGLQGRRTYLTASVGVRTVTGSARLNLDNF